MAFLGINKFNWVGLRFVCWFYDGHIQRLTKSGSMEKPGIKPATPGLQGIGLSPTPRRLLQDTYMFGTAETKSCYPVDQHENNLM